MTEKFKLKDVSNDYDPTIYCPDLDIFVGQKNLDELRCKLISALDPIITEIRENEYLSPYTINSLFIFLIIEAYDILLSQADNKYQPYIDNIIMAHLKKYEEKTK